MVEPGIKELVLAVRRVAELGDITERLEQVLGKLTDRIEEFESRIKKIEGDQAEVKER